MDWPYYLLIVKNLVSEYAKNFNFKFLDTSKKSSTLLPIELPRPTPPKVQKPESLRKQVLRKKDTSYPASEKFSEETDSLYYMGYEDRRFSVEDLSLNERYRKKRKISRNEHLYNL